MSHWLKSRRRAKSTHSAIPGTYTALALTSEMASVITHWHSARQLADASVGLSESRCCSGALLGRPSPRAFLWVSERRPRQANAQLLHTKLKCGALYSQTRSRSRRSSKDAVRYFKRAQDLGTLGLV
jgi:hypothetical protein